MGVFFNKAPCLRDACASLLLELSQLRELNHDAVWCYELSSFDEREFLTAVCGVERMAFKSRDRDFDFFGLGAAEVIKKESAQDVNALLMVSERSATLLFEQYYFGACRFDVNALVSSEWIDFHDEFFVLPLIAVIKKNGQITLTITYKESGQASFFRWLDHTKTLLKALVTSKLAPPPVIYGEMEGYRPNREDYLAGFSQVKQALDKDSHKKVVMGRRGSVLFRHPLDPVELYFRLKKNSHHAFLFFLDVGKGSAFLGRSPELLYRRNHQFFETEALAGTCARADLPIEDELLKKDLLRSFKENQEHRFVSLHIEEKLKEFGATDIFASDLEILSLPYVSHLMKRYRGSISSRMSDSALLRALHPTPAVCGVARDWALDFIRRYEGFDRGLYAGPIGFIGKDEVEFAVGIRSALFYKNRLFIYTAGGIIPASDAEQEWIELNNKEKNILSILEVRN